jgi:hypothetical protein
MSTFFEVDMSGKAGPCRNSYDSISITDLQSQRKPPHCRCIGMMEIINPLLISLTAQQMPLQQVRLPLRPVLALYH